MAENALGAAAAPPHESVVQAQSMLDRILAGAAQTWPARLAQGVWSGVTLPGDVWTGRVQMRDAEGNLNPVAIDRANELTGAVVTGGMPLAARGAAGIFGGRLAQAIDRKGLARSGAEEAERAGARPEDILAQTGWFRGADGKWRFEISDATAEGARFTPSNALTLGGHLNHPRLYDAYPDLYSMTVAKRFGRGASYDPVRDAISIGEQSYGKSTLLHEVQHAVQQREGFAAGGEPQMAIRTGFEAQLAPLARRLQMLQKEFASNGTLSREQGNELEWLVKVFSKNTELRRANANEAIRNYRRLAGEVEARNVESREPFGAEVRRQLPPWMTMDTPIENQLFSMTPVWTGPRGVVQ